MAQKLLFLMAAELVLVARPKMKNTIISSLILMTLAATPAFARDWDRDRDDHRCHGDNRSCVSAPEIDPGQALGALTLLSGSIAIVRGYRRRKK
jgi:hypothetical protein